MLSISSYPNSFGEFDNAGMLFEFLVNFLGALMEIEEDFKYNFKIIR